MNSNKDFQMSATWTISFTVCISIIAVTAENSEHTGGLKKKPEHSAIVHHVPQTEEQLERTSGSDSGVHSEHVEHHFLQPMILEVDHQVPESVHVEDRNKMSPNIDVIHKNNNYNGVEHIESESVGGDQSNKTETATELDVDKEVGADDSKMNNPLHELKQEFDLLGGKEDVKNLKNVELLRRSDRGRMEDEPEVRPHYFIKNVPSPDMFEPPEVHAHEEEEEEEKFVSELVFVNSHSHPHVVHQHKDYPRVQSFVHDEM